MKRIFDLIFSIFGLVLLSPLFILIIFLISITSKESVFFHQNRVGRYGNLFKIIKFRTMKSMVGTHSTISVKGDVRVTRIGAVLRKYKLDELPELLNVLKGEMSFVGPRPDVPGYADKLKGENKVILELRPGITSWASLRYANEEEILAGQKDPIEYNNNIIYPDKTKLNLDYYYNNSLWIDIKIIFATIFRKNY
tara:strand:- start:3966 stop:4550 length:585 start_codon:yes stop_codon:yes gene_type:complete